MKIYIMTDLEGICGVCTDEYMDPALPYYQDARRYLMAELNAAIAGAFDGGATEVVARDGHWRGNNFITDQLDPRAVHEGSLGTWYGTMDENVDATFVVGAHARAGTQNAFLDHTMSPESVFEYTINGRPMGEMGMWAAGCGQYDVPLIFVTGDEAACAEARELSPGCRTVAVKQAVCRNRARVYPIAKVLEQVRAAAADAVGNIGDVKPWKLEGPITCQQTYYRTDMADRAEGGNRKRIGPRTVRKVVDKPIDVVM